MKNDMGNIERETRIKRRLAPMKMFWSRWDKFDFTYKKLQEKQYWVHENIWSYTFVIHIDYEMSLGLITSWIYEIVNIFYQLKTITGKVLVEILEEKQEIGPIYNSLTQRRTSIHLSQISLLSFSIVFFFFLFLILDRQ